MKTKLFALMMAFVPFSNVSIDAAPVPVNLSIEDPTINQEGSHRGPAIPLVGIEDYTLTFTTPCYDYTLDHRGRFSLITFFAQIFCPIRKKEVLLQMKRNLWHDSHE